MTGDCWSILCMAKEDLEVEEHTFVELEGGCEPSCSSLGEADFRSSECLTKSVEIKVNTQKRTIRRLTSRCEWIGGCLLIEAIHGLSQIVIVHLFTILYFTFSLPFPPLYPTSSHLFHVSHAHDPRQDNKT